MQSDFDGLFFQWGLPRPEFSVNEQKSITHFIFDLLRMNIVSVDKKIEEIIAPYVDMGATATISLPPDCPKDLFDVLYVVSYHCGGNFTIVNRNEEI